MMKKFSFIIVALLLVLTACSNSENSSGSSSGNVTLKYWIWDKNQLPAMQDIAKEFEKKHPKINVKIEVTPWEQYWSKLETAATGNSLPDVFWMNGPNIVKYASNHMLLPINDQIKKDNVDLSNYPKALVDLYTVEGKHYGLPKDFDTIGLWYNKKLFDEAKVPYPDETWDWAKLKEAAKKLTNPSKGVWGIAAAMENQSNYYNTIFQNGGTVISDDMKKSGYDSPETIEGLKFWTDLIKDKVSPTQAQMTETKPNNLFESGKVAMMFAGSWMQIEFAQNDYTKDKVDVTVLPKGKKRAVVIHGLTSVISANTPHKKEAWEFVKYLGSKEAALIQAKTGTQIPAYNGTQKDWVESNKKFNLQVFIDSAKYATPLPISKDTSKWWDLETEYFKKAWGQEMRPEQAAKEVAKKMNELLSKE
ncbi:sugar ABC transporter substrate-binding protein [Fictibacillus sp. Mic-4]|uniref:ABC transporter substrate-binding protein n=1 Tax=Fictibacillus sp. Mic-4 TaxID=3132826 RepID=UPI003CFB6F1F